MSINPTIPMLQNSENDTVTFIALPLHIFQQSSQQPQSLVVQQNLLFKSLPDGTLIIDTNQLLNGNNNGSVFTPEDNNVSSDRTLERSEEETITEEIEPSEINNIAASFKSNDISGKNVKHKSKIRYLHSKSQDSIRKNVKQRKEETRQKMLDKNGPFKCTFCEKEFQKWVLYKRHEKSHVNEKKYKCNSCTSSYSILSNYLLHLATHNTEDPTCPECGKKFQRIASLKAHLMYHEKEETFYCEECDVSFNNEMEMNEHLKQHGNEKKVRPESLQCKYCKQKFTVSSEFKKHMSEHTKIRNILQSPSRKKPKKSPCIDLKHNCKICNKAFQKLSQIERHMRVHSGEKPYVCKICDRGFSQKGSLQIHMTRHTGNRPHKCALCPAKFSQKGNLRAHILKTHSVPHGGENVFSCSECSCVFKRLGSLNCHMTRNHPKQKSSDIKSLMSQLAAMQNNMANDSDILQQAINRSDLPEAQTEDKSNETPTATYVTLADLGLDGTMRRYIIKQRRVNDIRWHLCSFCPKEFKKPSDLVRHLRVHTREKPYKCKLCIRSFAVKSTLTTHIRTHTNMKKLQCKVCLKAFSSWSSLNVHVRKHTGQKPYKCSVCSKAFRSTVLLKQHSQMHLANEKNTTYLKELNSDLIMQQPMVITNKGLLPVSMQMKKRSLLDAGSKYRPYVCVVCTASFRKLSHLKQHHIKHTGERPFRCHLCYRNFSSSGVLKTHILTHNNSKPYKCLMCDKNFSTNGSLKRHLESHNNSKPYLCPYCFKNFKSILSCRKHMKLHKLEYHLQIQAIKHCGFADSELIQPKPSELPYPPDLTDTIDEDPFTLMPTLETQNSIESNKIYAAEDVSVHIPMVTQTLQADESGTVVLPVIENQENLTQENIRDIEDTLNSQMLNIIGSENFVDTNTYVNKINNSQPIATTDELVNTLTGNTASAKPIDDTQFLYQQVIVNLQPELEQMPVFDNTGIENLLSQVQNDSLFLADLNAININETNNVLLPFTMNPQTDFPQNQMIMMPTETDQAISTTDANHAVNLDAINAINGFLQSSENIQNTKIVLTNAAIQTNNEYLDAPDEDITMDTVPQLSNAAKVIEDEILNETISNNEPVATLLTDEVIVEEMDVICNVCKLNFQSKMDLKLHQCLNFVNVNVSNPSIENSSTDNASSSQQFSIANTAAVLTEKDFHEFVAEKEKNSKIQVEKEQPNKPLYRNQCTYCPKSFRKASDLQRHVRTHTGERPFKCAECAKSFSLKSTLDSHSKIHKGKKEFSCIVCNCLFTTKGSLSLHMRLHTGAKPFKCPLCSLKFRTSGHRKAHLTVHYKEALRTAKLPSEIVTRKAKMTELLEVTLQNIINGTNTNKEVENKETPSVENEQEPTEIENQSTLETIPQNEGNALENIVLDSNNAQLMQFEIQTNEEGHILNIKPAASNILLIDESVKNQMTSQYELDEKTRMQIENLIRESSSNNTTDSKKKAKKVCNVCNKEFAAKYLLDRHSKTHTGEKMFSCPQCSNTFNQKSALDTHMRIHSGSRPYSCPFCSNAFSQSGNLKTHIKRIHNIKVDQVTLKNDIRHLQADDKIQLENFPR